MLIHVRRNVDGTLWVDLDPFKPLHAPRIPCMVLLRKLTAVRSVQDLFDPLPLWTFELGSSAFCGARAGLVDGKLFPANTFTFQDSFVPSANHLWPSIVVDHYGVCLAVTPRVKPGCINVGYVETKQNHADSAVFVLMVFKRQRRVPKQPCNVHCDHVRSSGRIRRPCLQKVPVVWVPFATLILPTRHLFHHPSVQQTGRRKGFENI